MRKIRLIATAIMIGTAAVTNAQSVAEFTSIGPVVGIGNTWVGSMGGNNQFKPAPAVGLGFITARCEHFGAGGQLLFSAEGYDVHYGRLDESVTAYYMRMPLRGYYFFGSAKDRVRPNVFLGPELGVKLGESDNFGTRTERADAFNHTGTFRTLDFGLNTGGGLNIKLQKATWLNLDLVYSQGLADVVKDPGHNYNLNHSLGFNAGLYFGIR